MTLLRIDNLTHYFGGLMAVNDFNLDLQEGELIGLIGPNGAGKTTIFNLVTGAYHASEGSILFQGQELVGKPPHVINGLGISRTFQTIRLWNMMTVLDNVRVAHHPRITYNLAETLLRLPRYRQQEREITEHSMELLRLFKLERYANEQVSSLPYGAQRRVEIVRAMASAAQAAAARRTGGGYESQRDRRADGVHPLDPRRVQADDLADRAPDAAGDEYLRADQGAGLWRDDCRRHPGGDSERSPRDRGVPGRTTTGGGLMLLSVNDLHVSYGRIEAVHGVSFDVEEGEIVTLIGANGAGKSTILNTIARASAPEPRRDRLSRPEYRGVVCRTTSSSWGWRSCPKAAGSSAT